MFALSRKEKEKKEEDEDKKKYLITLHTYPNSYQQQTTSLPAPQKKTGVLRIRQIRSFLPT